MLVMKLTVADSNLSRMVDVTGQSKGKRVSRGAIKRHNFSMQDATHGNSLSSTVLLALSVQCQHLVVFGKAKKNGWPIWAAAQVYYSITRRVRVDTERKPYPSGKVTVPGSEW